MAKGGVSGEEADGAIELESIAVVDALALGYELVHEEEAAVAGEVVGAAGRGVDKEKVGGGGDEKAEEEEEEPRDDGAGSIGMVDA